MRYLPDDHLAHAILVSLGTGGYGSGFYMRHADRVFLVTAKHVLFSEPDYVKFINEKVTLTAYSSIASLKEPGSQEIDLIKARDENQIFIHPTADIVAVELGKLGEPNEKGSRTSINNNCIREVTNLKEGTYPCVVSERVKKYESILVSNEVVIFGYPVSLGEIGQFDITRPLLRKGMIAGKNDRNNTIVLDCPVFKGNSGGLAMEIEEKTDLKNYSREYYPIGVVSEFVPFVEHLQSMEYGTINTRFENSGYSIVTPIELIIEEINSKL